MAYKNSNYTISKEEFIENTDAHCRQKFPREFGFKAGKFQRNIIVEDSYDIYGLCYHTKFKDCYLSIYSFERPKPMEKWDRNTAKIDTLFLDFDDDSNPEKALKDTQKLVSYCLDNDITPRVYFSGKKGFHVYIDFPEINLTKTKEILRAVGYFLAEQLELTTLDTQVIEPARIGRLPFTINSKSGYRCTPLPPEKFPKMDFQQILRYVKSDFCPITPVESKNFLKFIKRYEFILESIAMRKFKEYQMKRARAKMDGILNKESKGKNWKQRRVEMYISAFKKYGKLAYDERIREIHIKSKWLSNNQQNLGAVEHLARVHLILLLIDLGYSDEEIHEIFKLSDDYTPKMVDYYIKYNKKWLEKQKNSQYP
jgi:DNA primase catalytic subunit